MITQNPDYFIAIVQSGSLTKAAEKLFVSQPALSQYLKRLESDLGIELFNRSTSPLTLTFAGEKYYNYILNIKRMESSIREELTDVRKEISGKLRLGVALWRSACFIPNVFPEFHRRYPKVSLELFEGRFAQMKQALENNDIDMAVVNLLPAGAYGDFDVEPIIRERILLAAPTGHPYVQERLKNQELLNGFPTIPLDILDLIPIAITKEKQSLTDMVTSVLARKHITPDILLRTANLTTAINLTASGMCCAFVPEEGAFICRHPEQVSYFALDDADFSWTLAFIYCRNTYLSAIAQNFIRCTKDVFSDEQTGP